MSSEPKPQHQDGCGCIVCKTHIDFKLPEELIEEFEKRNVVIFVGAGVSTESPLVLKYSLYDHVAAEQGRKSDGHSDAPEVPYYMLFGSEMYFVSDDEFAEALETAPQDHKASFRRAKRIVKAVVNEEQQLVLHHPCELAP